MFNIFNEMKIILDIKRLSTKEFCEKIKEGYISAIGHQGTIDLINSLCKTSFTMNRAEIKLSPNDELLMIQLRTRLPEGKVLTEPELQDLINKKMVEFYHVRVSF